MEPQNIWIESYVELGPKIKEWPVETIKNEPMLFSCDLDTANTTGGPITRDFLLNLSDEFLNSKDLIIDSRVHMLKNGWYSAIPGFHHDDVPREREDNQPNYYNPSYKARHCMALVGGGSRTEFAIGGARFPDVPIGQVYYRVWHPLVVEKIKNYELASWQASFHQLIYFDFLTWHQATPAFEDGWRFFIRATINTGRKPTNELRRQVQVYLEKPMEGW